jgi:predicted peroxiredoxin
VTVAFLVGGAAAEKGKQVAMLLTKEAVRLALPGHADAVACEGCPPLARPFEQYAEAGGELLVCPICFTACKLEEGQLVATARLAGATPLWDWIGEEPATVCEWGAAGELYRRSEAAHVRTPSAGQKSSISSPSARGSAIRVEQIT